MTKQEFIAAEIGDDRKNYVADYERACKNFDHYAAEEPLTEKERLAEAEQLRQCGKVVENLDLLDLKLLMYLQVLCNGKKSYIYMLTDRLEEIYNSLNAVVSVAIDTAAKEIQKNIPAAAQAVQ